MLTMTSVYGTGDIGIGMTVDGDVGVGVDDYPLVVMKNSETLVSKILALTYFYTCLIM